MVDDSYLGTGNPWKEDELTWNNAPALSGDPLGQKNDVAPDERVEFDVTTVVTEDGVYNFGMTSSSSNSVFYSSKEGSIAPQNLGLTQCAHKISERVGAGPNHRDAPTGSGTRHESAV